MNTERFVLADEVWEKASPHLPGKATDCGVTAADNGLFFEAVLWRVRTGSPWRDLPVAFGKSNSVFQHFRRWRKRAYSSGYLRFYRRNRTSHTPSSTAPSSAFTRRRAAQGGAQNQVIGRSRGGLTTKVVALVDALGTLVRFKLLPGQRHDMVGVAPLIRDVRFDALLADKAFDVDWSRAKLNQRGATWSRTISPRSRNFGASQHATTKPTQATAQT
jgi:transposase